MSREGAHKNLNGWGAPPTRHSWSHHGEFRRPCTSAGERAAGSAAPLPRAPRAGAGELPADGVEDAARGGPQPAGRPATPQLQRQFPLAALRVCLPGRLRRPGHGAARRSQGPQSASPRRPVERPAGRLDARSAARSTVALTWPRPSRAPAAGTSRRREGGPCTAHLECLAC